MKLSNMLILVAGIGYFQAHAQQNYEPILSLTSYERVIGGEIELNVKTLSEESNETLYIKAPVFLSYNLNDLRFFSAAPLKFIDMFKETPPYLALTLMGYYSDNRSNRVEAGLMYAESHSTSIVEGRKAEMDVAGYCENNLEIAFNIPTFEKQVRSGKNDLKYQMTITCKSTKNTQKDVRGKVKIGDIQLTNDVSLDVVMLEPSVDPDDFPDSEDVNSSSMEKFRIETFKNLPTVNATEINQFLMNPKGKKTFEFSGMYEWKSIPHNVTYTGTLVLDGTRVIDLSE